MWSLASRKLWLTASALILGAIAAELLAKHHAGRGMIAMAQAAAIPAERLRLHEVAVWHAHRSDLWGLVSLGFAALAVGSFLASRTRGEPGPQGVPIALGCLYVLLLLLIV